MIRSLSGIPELFDALQIEPRFDELDAGLASEARFIQNLKSSYAANRYAHLFYGLVRAWKPQTYLEFGVLSGYSLLSAALGLRKNENGRAVGIDLFEDYSFTKDHHWAVEDRIRRLALGNYCELKQGSVFEVSPADYAPDILHIDLSNNGEIVSRLFREWKSSVRKAFIFEGGTRERDQIEWMLKYQKPVMYPVFDEISRDPAWLVYQVTQFPTVTVLLRRDGLS